MQFAVLLALKEGFVFSFLKSEKFGTDSARGFSDCILLLLELGLYILADDRGTGAAAVRGVDEDKIMFRETTSCSFHILV